MIIHYSRAWTCAAFLTCLICASSIPRCWGQQQGLLASRGDFKTTLTEKNRDEEEMEEPLEALFELVKYPTKLGKMSAYLGKPPRIAAEKKKHPAIIWVTGGFPAGGAGSFAWEEPDPDNDQSAQIYRHYGLIMMYPSFRGSSGNPGHQESFYGEVDDLLAAADYLKKVDYVDPDRIYLGGHSTGGTLVLLAAAAAPAKFRAVISFGPVDDVAGYGPNNLTYDAEDDKENKLRSPIHHLDAIKTPTNIIEGESGNTGSLLAMKDATKSKHLHFSMVLEADHFSVLAPVNEMFAAAISDSSAEEQLNVPVRKIQSIVHETRVRQREAQDLELLAQLRLEGVDLKQKQRVSFRFLSRQAEKLEQIIAVAKLAGYSHTEIEKVRELDELTIHALTISKEMVLLDLKEFFATRNVLAKFESSGETVLTEWYVD